MKARLTVLFLIVFGLSACSPLTIRDVDTGRQLVMTGGQFILHQDLEVRPERTHVFFQNGQVTNSVGEYTPHCKIQVWKRVDTVQVIEADTFRIERVSWEIDNIVNSAPVVYASTELRLASGGGGNGNGESDHMHVWRMRLHSDRQPNVRYLLCGGAFDTPGSARDATLQDIQNSLGDIATLELP